MKKSNCTFQRIPNQEIFYLYKSEDNKFHALQKKIIYKYIYICHTPKFITIVLVNE